MRPFIVRLNCTCGCGLRWAWNEKSGKLVFFLLSASRDLTDCSIHTACERALHSSKHDDTATDIGIGVQSIWRTHHREARRVIEYYQRYGSDSRRLNDAFNGAILPRPAG